MSNSVKERFDFFKFHLSDAKKEFSSYRKNVVESLASREESIRMVRNLCTETRGITMLDEMLRDIQIFRSRLAKVNQGLTECMALGRKAEAAFIRKRETEKATDNATEAFMSWRSLRSDLCISFASAVKKWHEFEKKVATLMG